MINFLRGKVTPKDWVTVALLLGVTAALVVAFYMLTYQEQLVNIEKRTDENANVEADLVKAREIHENIETYIKETDEIRSLVKEFGLRLPSKREVATLIRDFERMATDEQVAINASQLKKNIQGQKETIPYRIEATGTFHQVASFINRLERFERYLKITDLEMLPNKDGLATFRFTLNTYRFLSATQP